MDQKLIIQNTIEFVKDAIKDYESGHDWFHIERVRNLALHIGKLENANLFIVELGALLHDIADPKFHNGDESIGPKKAEEFLKSIDVDDQTIYHIKQIIRNISFKNTFDKQTFHSNELAVLQDADKLDAIGAIGIARAFNYGGFKNHQIYDPAIAPNLNMSKEEYKKSSTPTINHFYEKLLLLKGMMNTYTGNEMAEERHAYMEMFLEEFYAEWKGER